MNIEERIKEIFAVAPEKKSPAEREASLAAACHAEPGDKQLESNLHEL